MNLLEDKGYVLGLQDIEAYEIPLGKHLSDEESPSDWVCPYCGVTHEPRGLIKIFGKFEVFAWSRDHKCDCEGYRKAKEKEVEMARLEEVREEQEREKARQSEIIQRANIQAEFADKNFQSFEVTNSNKEAYGIIEKYMENATKAINSGKGLYIYGDCGVGKTHIATAIALELQKQGFGVLFSTVTEYLNNIKNTFRDYDESSENIRKMYADIEILILDDIGKENVTTWSAEEVFALMDGRYSKSKAIIFTSNFDWAGLRNIYEKVKPFTGKAIESRLAEKTMPVFLGGEDYRKKRYKKAK